MDNQESTAGFGFMRLFRKHRAWTGLILGVLCVTCIAVIWQSTAPRDFPAGKFITIKDGTGLTQVADQLEAQHIIRSAFLYKAYSVLLRGGKKIQAGDYFFEAPQSVLRIAYRTINGIQDLTKIKVTIPEGLASYDIARLLAKNIAGFDSKAFLTLAKPHEGHLFPETYFFYSNAAPKDIVDQLLATFDQKIATVKFDILRFGKPQEDIVTMASIVEKEATSSIDRRIIAGVLWKRLADKFPLQVDPPFFYILGKDSSQLTTADLATDSPYNLYKHAGLPPTPIDNPGLDAIIDTINPTKTDYWYYLSDSKGNMHYASTLAGHSANRVKYLK